MHLTLRVYLGLMFLLLSMQTLAQTSDLALNGIAIHDEFGKEVFIGALYSDPLTNKIDSLANMQAIRMELKIVAPEGMTTRRFSRMWIEGMSVNNSSDLLTAQAENMVLFDNLLKGRLLQNDRIAYSYERTKGVNVTLNNILLGNIPSDQFFAMLLRTWIGSVPLSTDYKSAILKAGQVNVDLKNRFDSIRFTPERSEAIAQWIKTKPAIEIATSKKSDINSSASISASSTAPQNLTQTSNVVAISSRNSNNNKTASSATASINTEDDEKPQLTAQTLLVRQFYISTLLKKIRLNTKYPSRANELGQGGSLRVALVLNREGKVLHTQFVQGSQYVLLNQAVLEAIKQSTPLPPMPDELTGNTFEITVPITFVPVK